MNANDVLVDILDDNRRRLARHLELVSDNCLHWSPDGEANSIAVTLWHMGRLLDVFFTQLILGEPAANEIWIVNGWAEKTGYDPRGIGRDGWGAVNGYTADEVAAIPRFNLTQLLDYHNQICDRMKTHVQQTPIEELLKDAAGFDGRFSQYQVVQMAVVDNIRHLGEIYALKTMWERTTKEG